MRDVVLANHDLDVDAEIVRIAQDLDHAPDGVLVVFRELENLAR